MDIIDELQELCLASKLKRMSDRLFDSVDKIYANQQTPFQARWFALFKLILLKAPISVTECARSLGQTHSAVSQLSKKLIELELVQSVDDEDDERRRLLVATDKGQRLNLKLTPLWNDMRHCVKEVIVQTGVDLMPGLCSFEQQLNTSSLDERISERSAIRDNGALQIIPYSTQHAARFKELNVEWLEKYFYVESIDNEVLSEPDKYIIQDGGDIILAKYHNKIIGTCALIHQGKQRYELTKMSVTETYQGVGAGRKLAQTAIQMYKNLGGNVLFLESNRRLTPALKLYESLGFHERPAPGGPSHYQRADIYMEYQE